MSSIRHSKGNILCLVLVCCLYSCGCPGLERIWDADLEACHLFLRGLQLRTPRCSGGDVEDPPAAAVHPPTRPCTKEEEEEDCAMLTALGGRWCPEANLQNSEFTKVPPVLSHRGTWRSDVCRANRHLDLKYRRCPFEAVHHLCVTHFQHMTTQLCYWAKSYLKDSLLILAFFFTVCLHGHSHHLTVEEFFFFLVHTPFSEYESLSASARWAAGH